MDLINREDLPAPPVTYETTESLPPLVYDKLSGNSFRLLKTIHVSKIIQVSLQTFPMNRAPLYNALSYTWGSARPGDNLTAEPTWDIVCNGCAIRITKNLWNFLSTVHTGGTYLWVDALCINQQDIAERSEQVIKMGKIYSSAGAVVAWLGAIDEASRFAIATMEDFFPRLRVLMECSDSRTKDHHYLNTSLWATLGREEFTNHEANAFNHFFNRCWFDRTWILQEVVFAKQLYTVCGRYQIHWDSLVQFSRFLHDSGLSQFWSPLRSHVLKKAFVRDVFSAPWILDHTRKLCDHGIPISTDESLPRVANIPDEMVDKAFVLFLGGLVLHLTRGHECTRAVDKVYAAASLALHLFRERCTHTIYTLDYSKSTHVVYTELSSLFLQYEGSLELLCFVEDRFYRKQLQLPSWVPDFSTVNSTPLINLTKGFKFDCMRGHETEVRISLFDRRLLVRGYKFDIIGAIGPAYGVTDTSVDLNADPPDDQMSFPNKPTPWLEFAYDMEGRYPNGETFVMAFARTLIADQRENSDCNELLEFFRQYLLFTCVAGKEMSDLIIATQENFGAKIDVLELYNSQPELFPRWKIIDDFKSRRPTAGADVVPSFEELVQWMDRLLRPEDADKEYFAEVEVAKTFIGDAHLKAIAGRRLCRSQKGWIGLVPLSTKPGDEIWLMPGSKVPLVLRKIPGKMLYELCGEAYVHGIMYGELFSNSKFHKLGDLEPVLLI